MATSFTGSFLRISTATMYRKFLRSKIHRATVTHADLDYEGSLTLPPPLMRAADILPHEAVQVWNVTRGSRLETYAIGGDQQSLDISANGAAAHHIRPGDIVIIATFQFLVDAAEHPETAEPNVVFVDGQNRILNIGEEVPGPNRRDLPSTHADSCCR